jgi:aryl-alcohol dehydrogenase-like predicted oxidoreductase
MISKVCLGTVQFGLDYGIANQRGKVPKTEVFEILRYAQGIGIKALDTSMAYGDSEAVIGEFGGGFDVVSKVVVEGDGEVRPKLEASLRRLKIKKLYACLVHRFDDFLKNPQLWKELAAAQKEGLAKKIGFSLYHLEDLDMLWEKGISFDIIQVPYSVFDRRFEKYFKRLKEKGIEVHTRSVFLQGLAFLETGRLTGKLKDAAGTIDLLQGISRREGVSVSAMCLNYVLANPLVDKAVIGVDSLEHLKSDVQELKEHSKVLPLKTYLDGLAIQDEEILLPYKWNRS